MNVPLSTKALQISSYSAFEPSHQRIRSGVQWAATSFIQTSSSLCETVKDLESETGVVIIKELNQGRKNKKGFSQNKALQTIATIVFCLEQFLANRINNLKINPVCQNWNYTQLIPWGDFLVQGVKVVASHVPVIGYILDVD